MIDPILISLIIFGVWISYTDIKKSEIKNYSVLALIAVAIFINTYFTRAFVELPLASFLNILGAILMGVMIWLAGIWSAADAKLFIAINLLLPVTLYRDFAGYFPGFIVLINSSVPLFLFLFLQILFKTSLKEKRNAFLAYLKPSPVFQILLVGAAMSCLSFLISFFLKIRVDYFLWIILLLFLFWFVERKLKIHLTVFFLLIIVSSALLAMIFDLPLFTAAFLISVFRLVLLFFSLLILLALGDPLFTRPVKIDKLKEGMIPAEMIVKEGGAFVKKPVIFFNLLSLLRQRNKQQYVAGFNPDGLNKEEIAEIRSLSEKGVFKANELKISLIIPFALVLFIGALLTYFSRGIVI